MSIRTNSGLAGSGGPPEGIGGHSPGAGAGGPGGPGAGGSGPGGRGASGMGGSKGRLRQRRRTVWAGVCGLVAVALGVAGGELTAAAVSPSLSPITAVGGVAIDAMPPGVKEGVISLFGTSDKLVFLLSMCVVIAALAFLAGIAELRRKFAGIAGIAVFGVIGVLAVLSRAESSTAALAGPLVAAGLGMVFLTAFRNRLREWLPAEPGAAAANAGPAGTKPVSTSEDGAPAEAEPAEAGPADAWPVAGDRRRFLKSIGVGAVVAVVAGTFAAVVRTTATGIQEARAKLRLPPPASPAPAIPAAARVPLAGLTPLVTPNTDFYRIDTALVVPTVDPAGWKLGVTGMVDREVEIDLATLLGKPLIERYVTIACVSNEVGGDLIGNAKWLGWPVRELLAMAGVKSGADMVLSSSTDGFTASTPLQAMTDQRDAIIAVGMNGDLLPLEHGFPARLIVPGLYGFVSATKWVSNLKVTTFANDAGYWTSRGWSDHGPIKTSSRIDVPRDGGSVKAGRVAVGGVAWAQERGISKVQVRVDRGNWQDAMLAEGISKDTWYQWSARLDLAQGSHQLQVRAFDGGGTPQTEQVEPVAPNGASGYHTITVSAG